MKPNSLPIYFIVAALLTSCGSGSDSFKNNKSTKIENFEFTASENWQAGFADYPVGAELLYELFSEFKSLPSPLSTLNGLRVSGNNHSDDLFMFVKTSITGLKTDTRYGVAFNVTLATNAQAGCFGVGGPPGEGVYVKAGVSVTEPKAENDGSGYYLMNIDKGNQMVSGSDAIVLGNMANTQPCGEVISTYELKQLDNSSDNFSVITDSSGTVWVMFATDSAFESTTDMYWEKATVTFTQLP